MSRFVPLLLLTTLLIAGCTKEIDGTAAEAAVEAQTPKTSITDSVTETFRLPGFASILPGLYEDLAGAFRDDGATL